MKTDVVVGARTLRCSKTLAKTDIVLEYTPDSTVEYQTITASGTFTIPDGNYNRVQFFAVGGGGGGQYDTTRAAYRVGSGGGGGFTKTTDALLTSAGTQYTVVVGAGGSRANDGNSTSVSRSGGDVVVSASGGKCSTTALVLYSGYYAYTGGDGGSGGGPGYWYKPSGGVPSVVPSGGSDGNSADSLTSIINVQVTEETDRNYKVLVSGGTGQGISTTFNGVLYAGGGGGCIKYSCTTSNISRHYPLGGQGGGGRGAITNTTGTYSTGSNATAGTANTGGGGGGGEYREYGNRYGKAGGSGVVIVKLWEE